MISVNPTETDKYHKRKRPEFPDGFDPVDLALVWVLLQVATVIETTLRHHSWIDQSALVLQVLGSLNELTRRKPGLLGGFCLALS